MTLKMGRIALSTKDMQQEDIGKNILHSIECFCEKNNVRTKNINAIIFSQTQDINTWNPAQQLRRCTDDFSQIALFCTSEPEYEEGVLEQGIRMLIFFNKFTIFPYTVKSVYIFGAESLRQDITGSSVKKTK